MMEFIRWLVFIKIVSQSVKRFETVVIKKKRLKKIAKKLHVSNKMSSVVM